MARTSPSSYRSAYSPDEDEEEKRARAMETFQEFRQPLEPDLPMGAFPSPAEATEAAKPAPLGAGHVRPEREVAPAGHGGESTGGWDEGTKDSALAALAGFLDIMTNKGRGVGSILQASSSQASQRARAKERGKKDAQDYQLQAQRMVQDRSNSERRFEGEESDRKLRMSQQEIEKQRALEIHERWRSQNDPNNPANVADLEYRQALTAEAKARAARDPNAITPYQQMEHDARAAERAERGKDRDEARTSREQLHALSLQDRKDAREAAAGVAAATRENTNTLRENEANRINENDRQGKLNKFRDETEKTRLLVTNAEEMEKLLPTDKKADIPGVGELDSMVANTWPLKHFASDEAIGINNQLAQQADTVLRWKSGAAAPDPETKRIAGMVGQGKSISEKEFRIFQEGFNTLLRTEMQQQSVGREDVARDVLGSRADWALGARKPPAAAAPLDITDQLGQPGPVNDPRIAPQQQQLSAAVEEEDAPAPVAPPTIQLGKGRTPRRTAPELPGGTDGSELMPPGITNSNIDQLPTTGQNRDQVTKPSDHLRRLQEEDDDIGARYRP